MDVLLWLILAVLPLVNSFDPGISNGTCYFAPNQQAASNFIPCGNAAGGVQSCCQSRDTCLSSNACFNGEFFVTYLAGCTDENYDDPRCPSKGGFPNQQWAGLVRCHVSDGTGEEWAACSEPASPKLNKGNEKCTCTKSSSTAVFTDAAVLTNIASLPVAVGNKIFFFSGFEPSTTIADASTTQSGSAPTQTTTSRGTSTSPTMSATSIAVPDTQVGALTTGAKAGIGIGVAGAVVLIGALLLWFIWNRRKRSRVVPPIKDQIRPNSINPWGMEETDFARGAGAGGHNHKSWGAKSELPTEANEVTTANTSLGENTIRSSIFTPATTYQPYQRSPTVASEMDGSPAASTSGLYTGNHMHEKPTRGPIYEMPG